MEFSKEMSFFFGLWSQKLLQFGMQGDAADCHAQQRHWPFAKVWLGRWSRRNPVLPGESGRFSGNPKAVPFPFATFRNRTPKDVGKKNKTSHWSPGIDVAQARGADSELIKKATSWRMEDVVHSTSVVWNLGQSIWSTPECVKDPFLLGNNWQRSCKNWKAPREWIAPFNITRMI